MTWQTWDIVLGRGSFSIETWNTTSGGTMKCLDGERLHEEGAQGSEGSKPVDKGDKPAFLLIYIYIYIY